MSWLWPEYDRYEEPLDGRLDGYTPPNLRSGSDLKGTPRSTRWSIELQVDFNESNNIAVASRPDFVIRCLSYDESEVLPVAVFTDGFEFHADSVAQDTAKRFALM